MSKKGFSLFVFLIVLVNCAFSQQDYVATEKPASNNPFRFSLMPEAGAIFNIAEKSKSSDYKQNWSTNLTLGIISAKLDYKNYFACLGFHWHAYTVSVTAMDPPTQTGHKYGSTSENYVYSRIPFKLGWQVQTGYSWLKIAPFIEANFLHTLHSGISFTSSSYGNSINERDTIQDSLAVSMARPYKNAFAPGAGLMLIAGKKHLKVSLISEYFQSTKYWTAIRSYYYRNSSSLGILKHTDYYNSKAKSIVVSLAISYQF